MFLIRHSGVVTPAKPAPCYDTGAGAESSKNNCLLDAVFQRHDE